MRVICINNKPFAFSDYPHCASLLKEGEIYTVINESSDSYSLDEIKHPYAGTWYKQRFIPLSSIDETELVNQKVEIYDTRIMGGIKSL